MVQRSTTLSFKKKFKSFLRKGEPDKSTSQTASLNGSNVTSRDENIQNALAIKQSDPNTVNQSQASTVTQADSGPTNAAHPSNVSTNPSPNPSISSAVHQTSLLKTPSPDSWSPQVLWEDAYKQLSNTEPDLVTEFEKVLCGNFASNEQVQSIVQAQLDLRIEDQWSVNVLGKDVKIRKMGEDLIKFLVWSKDLVTTSLSSQPHVALAWSAATMLLPLLLTPTQESDAMIEGLDHITSILKPYQIRTELQRNTGSGEYRDAVVNLYSCCLEYQARMACHLSKRTAARGVLSLTRSGQWTSLIHKIDAADEECSKHQTLIDRKQEDEMWKLQTKHMEDQEKLLKQLYKLNLDDLNNREAAREDGLRDKVIECLVGDYPEQKDANPEAVEDTCRWFLDDARFHKWRESTTSSLLWLHAGAGCGKSVLSRELIDNGHLIRPCRAMTSTVCYFFFKNLDSRNTGADMLRGVLHQLYTQKLHTNLISVAYDACKLYKQELGSMFNTLWDLFLNTTRHPDAGEIICVLDALDECRADARKALLAKLVHFFNASAKDTSPQQPCLKFLITSQYRDDIDHRFASLDPASNWSIFPGDDRSDILRREIDLVIDRCIPEKVPKLNQQSQLLLAQYLKSIEHRTYLWLHLVLEEIEEKFPSNSTLPRIKVLINELPTSVNDAYEGILRRSPDPQNVRVILQIVLAAKRELTVNELTVAWHVARSSSQPRSYQDLDLPDEDYRKGSLQAICGSFIRIVDSRVMLIHDTARQYLVQPQSQLHPVTPSVWQHSLALLQCEYLCAQICMTVLCFNFDNQACPWASRDNRKKYWHIEFEEKVAQQELLKYSSKSWAEHLRKSEEICNEDEIRLAASLCNPQERAFKIWFPIYWWTSSISPWSTKERNITVSSLLGLSRVVKMMIDKGESANTEGGYFGNPLQGASDRGHEKVVKTLLDHGAVVNTQAWLHGNALQAASARGSETVVQMLLERGADVNAEGGRYWSALMAASEFGHETVVQMLLDHGAEVNIQGGKYWNALQAASAGGHGRVVGILLKNGADVNLQGGIHGNALQAALVNDHEAIMQMLLRSGANVDAQGGEYTTALLAAIDGGCERVVLLLLDWGADVNAPDEFDGNPLHLASMAGNETIAQMLLDRGAEVNATGGFYGNALQAASDGGYENIVRILLEQGADVNAEGGQHGSALQAASAIGNERLVELLLQNGANVNFKGGESGTALQAAIEGGHKTTIQMLLDAGADEDLAMSDVNEGKEEDDEGNVRGSNFMDWTTSLPVCHARNNS